MASAGKGAKYIVELDSLRCLAILTVLAVHFQPPNQPIWKWMSLGWVGVDVFFVISGYLITNILLSMRGAPHPYQTFYWRRIIRIFPPYYGYLALVAIATRGQALRSLLRASLFLTAVPLDSAWIIGARLFHHLSFAAPVSPIRDHLFASSGDGFAMLWSLSIEEFFYLFWAPVVLRGSRRFITTCAVIPILICPVLRGLGHTSSYPEYFRFIFRIDILMFGAVVALLHAAVKRGKLGQQVMGRLTAAALIISPFILLPMVGRGLLHNIEIRSTYLFAIAGYSLTGLFFAGVVSWCVGNANSPSVPAAILRNRLTAYIGRISYGMYLIHIYAFVGTLTLVRHFRGADWTPGIGLAATATLLTVGLATLSYRYFETPILRLKQTFAVIDSQPLPLSAQTASIPQTASPMPQRKPVEHVPLATRVTRVQNAARPDFLQQPTHESPPSAGQQSA